jgi:hyperosmotically inducible protein
MAVDRALRTDEEIKRDVVDSLYWDDRVNAADIAVTVRAGAVTLSGAVPSYRAREAAREDALVISGVVTVDNEIEVSFEPAAEVPTDEEIRDAAMGVLTTDPDVDAGDVTLDAQGGHVTVRGSVSSYWEKQLVEEVLGAIRGVRRIDNQLVVVPGRDIVDREIAASVVGALERNRSVNAAAFEVEVDGGRVGLAGTVPSWSASQAVVKAARYTEGVTEVEDHLQVSG